MIGRLGGGRAGAGRHGVRGRRREATAGAVLGGPQRRQVALRSTRASAVAPKAHKIDGKRAVAGEVADATVDGASLLVAVARLGEVRAHVAAVLGDLGDGAAARLHALAARLGAGEPGAGAAGGAVDGAALVVAGARLAGARGRRCRRTCQRRTCARCCCEPLWHDLVQADQTVQAGMTGCKGHSTIMQQWVSV